MHIDPLSWWASQVSKFAPVGHVLRRHLHDRWTRFHSLPESKRYGENAPEYEEVLRRHLAVANELFVPGEPIYIFRSQIWERKLKGKLKYMLAGNQLREKMIRLPTGLDVQEDEDGYYCVRAFVTSWVPQCFSLLTRQIADWEEAGVTLVSPATRNTYCPYDGGMDVFPGAGSPSTLEAKFRSWMSLREDKM